MLRNNKRVLEVALDSGISTKTANSRGWNALDEAIAAKNKELVGFLYASGLQEVKAEMKAAKTHLIQTLREMPDYSMEVRHLQDATSHSLAFCSCRGSWGVL